MEEKTVQVEQILVNFEMTLRQPRGMQMPFFVSMTASIRLRYDTSPPCCRIMTQSLCRKRTVRQDFIYLGDPCVGLVDLFPWCGCKYSWSWLGG